MTIILLLLFSERKTEGNMLWLDMAIDHDDNHDKMQSVFGYQ